ncbi:hypothetical protein, partial [Rhizobium leguminosarum]|uniref:hypothetical protein n=1 Tax=Rhizobium leguminosarum TaxID=384 RepID=UPI00195455F3
TFPCFLEHRWHQSGDYRNVIRRDDFGHDGMASFRRPRFSFFKKTKNRVDRFPEWARSSVG